MNRNSTDSKKRTRNESLLARTEWQEFTARHGTLADALRAQHTHTTLVAMVDYGVDSAAHYLTHDAGDAMLKALRNRYFLSRQFALFGKHRFCNWLCMTFRLYWSEPTFEQFLLAMRHFEATVEVRTAFINYSLAMHVFKKATDDNDGLLSIKHRRLEDAIERVCAVLSFDRCLDEYVAKAAPVSSAPAQYVDAIVAEMSGMQRGDELVEQMHDLRDGVVATIRDRCLKEHGVVVKYHQCLIDYTAFVCIGRDDDERKKQKQQTH